MILADTSVWIDHFHKRETTLVDLLNEGAVCIHPFIVGELACGNIKNRKEILALLSSLPKLNIAEPDEMLFFIDSHKLYGRGLGYIDVHLIASCFIDSVKIYTKDKRLDSAAQQLNIRF